MNKLVALCLVAMTFSFNTVKASEAAEVAAYSAEVGVQAIARAVIEKKLVNREARKVILLALETGKAGLGKMECDPALGADVCSFAVFIKDDKTTPDAEEAVFQLDVNFREGKITSAKFELIAG